MEAGAERTAAAPPHHTAVLLEDGSILRHPAPHPPGRHLRTLHGGPWLRPTKDALDMTGPEFGP